MMSKKNVPELRFPEFSGEWDKIKLNKISNKVREKNKDMKISETLTNSAQFGIVSQRDYFDKDISSLKSLSNYYVVKPDDFVYNPRISKYAPVGPVKRNKLNRLGVMSPLYYAFRTKDIDKEFLEYYFETTKWHKFMYFNGDTGARSDRFSIKDSVFQTMDIPYPEEVEQRKIGSLFKKLDLLIELEDKKLELLEEQKKGYMQKVFSQELRFKDENGKGYPEWRSYYLKEVSERITRKNTDLSSKRPLTISGKLGLVDQVTYFSKSVSSKNLENYTLIKEGEFAYNKSYSKGYPFGAIKKLEKYEEGALSTLYICFKIKEHHDSDFIKYYFESSEWHKEVSLIAVEGARNHGLLNIPVNDFFNIQLKIPSLKEQQRISEFLGLLDHRINFQDRKAQHLKKVKHGLLTNMFI